LTLATHKLSFFLLHEIGYLLLMLTIYTLTLLLRFVQPHRFQILIGINLDEFGSNITALLYIQLDQIARNDFLSLNSTFLHNLSYCLELGEISQPVVTNRPHVLFIALLRTHASTLYCFHQENKVYIYFLVYSDSTRDKLGQIGYDF
jgi:hypothetical protein